MLKYNSNAESPDEKENITLCSTDYVLVSLLINDKLLIVLNRLIKYHLIMLTIVHIFIYFYLKCIKLYKIILTEIRK